jgi:hypothetical protein
MSFRKELKYRLSTHDDGIIKTEFLKAGAKILFPERHITSRYFDTSNLRMFQESEEGTLPRRKIRIRHYSNSSKVFKEEKITSFEGRFKLSNELNEYDTQKSNFCENLFDARYGNVFHSTTVQYIRSYLTYGPMRITLDKNIKYSHPSSPMTFVHDNECVVEVKAEIDTSDYFIENITKTNPVRFSKYCRGIKFLKIRK